MEWMCASLVCTSRSMARTAPHQTPGTLQLCAAAACREHLPAVTAHFLKYRRLGDTISSSVALSISVSYSKTADDFKEENKYHNQNVEIVCV